MRNFFIKPFRNENGFILAAVVAISVLAFFLLMFSITRGLNEEKRALMFYQYHKIRNLSESGLEYAIWKLKLSGQHFTGQEEIRMDDSIIHIWIEDALQVPGKKEILVSVANISKPDRLQKSLIASVFVSNARTPEITFDYVQMLDTADPVKVFGNVVRIDKRGEKHADQKKAASRRASYKPVFSSGFAEKFRIFLGTIFFILFVFWIILTLKGRW